jgi:hypothetical protein
VVVIRSYGLESDQSVEYGDGDPAKQRAFFRGVAETIGSSLEYEPSSELNFWPGLSADDREPMARDLRATLRLERDLERVTHSSLVPRKTVFHLQYLSEQWQAALPFVGSEYRNFAAVYEGAEVDHQEEIDGPITWHLDTVERAWFRPVRALAAGHHQETPAAVLISRWWDWRRGAGDYAEDNTRTEAHAALGHIAMTLEPFVT